MRHRVRSTSTLHLWAGDAGPKSCHGIFIIWQEGNKVPAGMPLHPRSVPLMGLRRCELAFCALRNLESRYLSLRMFQVSASGRHGGSASTTSTRRRKSGGT
jgi:hypothetical protein